MIHLQLLSECCFGCLKEFCFGTDTAETDQKMIPQGTPRSIFSTFSSTEAIPPDENTYLLNPLPNADASDPEGWNLYDAIMKIDPKLKQMDDQRKKEIEDQTT